MDVLKLTVQSRSNSMLRKVKWGIYWKSGPATQAVI